MLGRHVPCLEGICYLAAYFFFYCSWLCFDCLGGCWMSALPIAFKWHGRWCVPSLEEWCILRPVLLLSIPVKRGPGGSVSGTALPSLSALMPFFFFSRPHSQGMSPVRAVRHLTLKGMALKKTNQCEGGWETPALPFLPEEEILSRILRSVAVPVLSLTLRKARASPNQLA